MGQGRETFDFLTLKQNFEFEFWIQFFFRQGVFCRILFCAFTISCYFLDGGREHKWCGRGRFGTLDRVVIYHAG